MVTHLSDASVLVYYAYSFFSSDQKEGTGPSTHTFLSVYGPSSMTSWASMGWNRRP